MKDVVVDRKTASHHRIVPIFTPGVRRTYPDVLLYPAAKEPQRPLKSTFCVTRNLASLATLPVPDGEYSQMSVKTKIERELVKLSPEVAAYIKGLIPKADLIDLAGPTPEHPKANSKTRQKKKKPHAVEATPLAERRWLTVKEALNPNLDVIGLLAG